MDMRCASSESHSHFCGCGMHFGANLDWIAGCAGENEHCISFHSCEKDILGTSIFVRKFYICLGMLYAYLWIGSFAINHIWQGFEGGKEKFS